MNYDIVIVGSGLAGISTALKLNKNFKIALITKKSLSDCNSYLAQGGICVLKNSDDRESFIEDTLKAGHYENKRESVEILVDESIDAVKTLVEYGVSFTSENNKLHYTKEGGHSTNRILHCNDATGKYIMKSLIEEVKNRKNIEIFENTEIIDLIVKNNICTGVLSSSKKFIAPNVILATGGLGGLFKHSTNYSHIKGDGIAIAINNNVKLKDISYIQIHPTSLYEENSTRRFLISESVRGEGAILLNHNNKRFTNELNPRDIVSKEIYSEMEKEKVDFEFLSMREIGIDKIENRFPMIFENLLNRGIDPRKENLKIVPAEHYTMGGIDVDLFGKTSLKGLYAVGEVANTGVHGKNRLASNSLLESVVYGKRLANYINSLSFKKISEDIEVEYKNYNSINNKEIIEKRIEEDARVKKYNNRPIFN